MKISPIHFPYPSPIVASMRAVEMASLTLADMAENAADKGTTANTAILYPVETRRDTSAIAAAPHHDDKIEDEILDILT